MHDRADYKRALKQHRTQTVQTITLRWLSKPKCNKQNASSNTALWENARPAAARRTPAAETRS